MRFRNPCTLNPKPFVRRSMPQFHVRLAGDDLVFSAGHFITLADGQCERLHGHTYRVTAEIHGPLGAEQYVVDFVTAGNMLRAILAELDHRMLLPTLNPAIQVSAVGRSGSYICRAALDLSPGRLSALAAGQHDHGTLGPLRGRATAGGTGGGG